MEEQDHKRSLHEKTVVIGASAVILFLMISAPPPSRRPSFTIKGTDGAKLGVTSFSTMRSVDAAISIASRFGIETTSDPVILSDSNNVVLWLRPAPVVAKVAAGHHRLALELAVGKHLVTLDAPVVPPAAELPERVHRFGDFEVTF